MTIVDELNSMINSITSSINSLFSNAGKAVCTVGAVVAVVVLIWISFKAYKDVANGQSSWGDHIATILTIVVLALILAGLAALLPAGQ